MQVSCLTPLLITLKVAGTATVFSLCLGCALGILFARRQFPGKDILDTLITLPLVFPPTVVGYYLMVLIGRHGWLGQWLYETFGIRLIFTCTGAVIAAVAVSVPIVYKSARASFEAVERDFEDAARTLGKPETGVFLRITLPLSWRGILAGTMIAFARSMGEFGATLMVAGNLPGRTQTLSMAIYDAVQAGESMRANILVLVTTIACGFILFSSQTLLKRAHWSAGGGIE
ncbi:MAG: molybdate ABC transporter permease subunit [Deltaproteobacteria bacterium]|nr:molybdate ABC transporter permease subunit [Deltaproteobacteria bacterium]